MRNILKYNIDSQEIKDTYENALHLRKQIQNSDQNIEKRREKRKTINSEQNNTKNEIELRNGYYKNYKYSWVIQDSKYFTTFSTKMLPRDDAVVFGAISHLIHKFCGNPSLLSPNPEIIHRNGISIMKFKGRYRNYFVTIAKQDTGEVWGIMIWIE
jgi:hypothetical protein